MTVARFYVLEAPAGAEQRLLDALTGLAGAVRRLPGCNGVELLQDAARPHRFIFIEKWASMEAHKATAAMLPKDALTPVMAALAGKPEISDFNYVVDG
jgi:quinol monooxygenase YgiN